MGQFVIAIHTMCGLAAVSESVGRGPTTVALYATRKEAEAEILDSQQERAKEDMDALDDGDEEVMTLAEWQERGGELQ